MSGEFTMVNEYLVYDLKKLGMWNDDMLAEIKQNEGSVQDIAGIPDAIKAKYKETFEIDSKVFINLAAYRGKWIDQSQSLNLFYRGTSGREIGDMYMYAWEMGLKTTYYLRTLAASSIEKATTTLKASDRKPENDNPTIVTNSTEPVASVYSQPIPFPAEKPVATYSEVEHALKVVKEKTLEQAHKVDSYIAAKVEAPTSKSVGTGAGTATIKVNGKEIKISKILDPDCEACQ